MNRPWHPRLDRLQRRIEELGAAIHAHPDSSILGPDGEGTTPTELGARAGKLLDLMNQERYDGSRQHDRIGPLRRIAAWSLPLLDCVILAWFLSWTLNAPLRTPIEPTLLVAIALAMLATLAVATWSTLVGASLRRFKDHAGNLVWHAVDPIGRTMIVLTLIMATLLGAMMEVRVREETYQATGVHDTSGSIVAIALAFATFLLNLYVVYLHFADGSTLTTQLRHTGRIVLRHRRRQDRRYTQVTRLEQRYQARREAMTWLDTSPRIVRGGWIDQPPTPAISPRPDPAEDATPGIQRRTEEGLE